MSRNVVKEYQQVTLCGELKSLPKRRPDVKGYIVLQRHLLLCAVGLLTYRAGTYDFGRVARDRAAGQETRRAKWRCSNSRPEM
jgi:hypothetical protein